MTTINTYEDLVRERDRLKLRIAQHKENINTDIQSLKEKFAPFLFLLPVLSFFQAQRTRLPLINTVAKLGVDMLAHRFLGRSMWLTKLAVPMVVKKLVAKVMNKVAR
jgi:hypothetical protein